MDAARPIVPAAALLLLALTVPAAGTTAAGTTAPAAPFDHRQRPRDVAKETLERWRLEHGAPAPAGSNAIQSNGTVCGIWTALSPAASGFWRGGARTVYDSVRDRMIIVGGSPYGNGTGGETWALSFSPSVSLTDLEATVDAGTIGDRGASAIYDPVRDRVIAFGGYRNGGTPFGVWQLPMSGPAVWTELVANGTEPEARSYHTAIYDAAGDRMIVFGGQLYAGGLASGVWALTLSGTPAWTQLSPTGTGPGGLYSHTAVYDGPRNRMVVFGGYDLSGTESNEVWALSLSGSPTWSHIAPSGGPPAARGYHAAVVDAPRNRMLVYSGSSPDGYYSDVWALSFTNPIKWTPVTPTGTAPVPQDDPAAIYDPVRGRLVTGFNDEFWATENLAGTPSWSMVIVPDDIPLGRYGAAGIYDLPRNRLLVYGGQKTPYGRGDDLWAFSLAGGTWSRLATTGTRPPHRAWATAIYDATGNRMILFGGDGIVSPLNDTWQLSLTSDTWSPMSPTGTPPSVRYAHTAILDAPRNRMIVYGGGDNSTTLGDVWSLSLAGGGSWTQLGPSGGPAPAREFHTSIFDAPRNRMLTFGWDSNVVWSLSLAGSPAWSTVTTSGTPPPTMAAPGAAYDPTRDRMLVSNGPTYALTLSGTPTWSQFPDLWPYYGDSPTSDFDTAGDRWLLFGGGHSALYALSFPATFTITTSASPPFGGSVGRSPSEVCQPSGATVTLSAVPASGYGFTGWSGDATGTTNPLMVTMSADKDITANFSTFPLSVSVAPPFTGTVGKSPDLPSYAPGSQVTLTATPATGYGFGSWSGDASGSTNPLTVTMDGPKNITANFLGYPVNVAVSPSGSGTVAKSPNQAVYPPGSQVTLTATPATGYAFANWSGDASGSTNPLTITVNGPKSITANFLGYPVNVAVSPSGSGTVTKSPNQAVYPPGSQVTLAATPAAGYGFANWSGDASGSTSPLTITVDGPKSITGNFTLLPVACGEWGPVPSATLPSARVGASVAWDPVRHRVLMFGGFAGGQYFSDVWQFTVAEGWTQIATAGSAPSPRDAAGLIYDPVRDRMLVVAGNSNSPPNDVWALSLGSTPTWSQLAPTGTPPAGRFAFSAIYDPVRDRVLLFGGYPLTNETWALSLAGPPSWALLSPSGSLPAARYAQVGIYDPVRDRMLIQGGSNLSAVFSDVWALGLGGSPTWAQLATVGAAPARWNAAGAYDPIRDRLMVVGGSSVLSGQPDEAVWSLSLEIQPIWRRVAVGGAPLGARRFHNVLHEPEADAILSFFGINGSSAFLDDAKRLVCSGGWWLQTGGAHGTVTATPSKTCYANDEVVSLQAVNSETGYFFQQWLGDASGNNPQIDVTMNGSKTVVADFQFFVGVGDAPLAFALEVVGPSPSRGPIEVVYSLPDDAPVALAVYDVAGREVGRLADGVHAAGRHHVSWDGRREDGSAHSGVYFIRYQTPIRTWVRRVALVR
jgi:uncharacterized repeat protein (TIGR02543 family)